MLVATCMASTTFHREIQSISDSLVEARHRLIRYRDAQSCVQPDAQLKPSAPPPHCFWSRSLMPCAT